MIKHEKLNGVADVDKFLNKSGLKLPQVQIVYAVQKFGGNYFVFYDTDDVKETEEKPVQSTGRKPKVATESELVLTDVTGSPIMAPVSGVPSMRCVGDLNNPMKQ